MADKTVDLIISIIILALTGLVIALFYRYFIHLTEQTGKLPTEDKTSQN